MSKKKVVIINGSGGVGKDSFIDAIRKYATVVNYSSVEMIKWLARCAGWDGVKDDKGRKFLSDLKRVTTEYNDLSYRCTLEVAKAFVRESKDAEILFIHVREPEEIERIKTSIREMLNAFVVTLLITRESVSAIVSNASDKNVLSYNYDYCCKNDGSLDDLDATAKSFLCTLRIVAE